MLKYRSICNLQQVVYSSFSEEKEYPFLALKNGWYKNNCQNLIMHPSDIDPFMSASAVDSLKNQHTIDNDESYRIENYHTSLV